jgi:hypothetical protein
LEQQSRFVFTDSLFGTAEALCIYGKARAGLQKFFAAVRAFVGEEHFRVLRSYLLHKQDAMEEIMTRIVILGLALGLFAAPAYAQKGSTNINGNIFDAPPGDTNAYGAPPAQGPAARPAMTPRAAAPRHVRRHHTTTHAEQ